ncbi:MAG TPA: hypothetical protein VJ023_04445 [Pyrinomonadaceae bacterium]|nr:hypothetical protein [Pyrinomonadaceae bacterium]
MRSTKLGMLRAFCATPVLLLAVQFALSQTPTPTPAGPPGPEFLSITVVSVKPEMMVQFQDFMKTTTNPALQKGGLKWREVWQSTNAAGDAFEFVLVAPVGKFAEYDGPSPIEKALGAQGSAAWMAKAGSFVNSVRRYIVRTRPDLSNYMMREGPPKLAVITAVHVAQNRNAEFENYLKNDFVPVLKQAKAMYLVSQTIFGGNANEYISLVLRDSFAELDKGPPLMQVLGEEGAMKLLQKLPAGVVTHVERSITRYAADLSFGHP